jgi:hypothetical protein
LLLRSRDFSIARDGVQRLVAESPIAKQLFIDPSPSPSFTLVSSIRRTLDDDGPDGVYARLFKVAE